jgi:hypothetical protein
MNANEIMENAIGYSTPELDNIKSDMVVIIEKMLAYIPELKAKGMSEFVICADASIALRRVFLKRVSGNTSYTVQRDGRTAMIGLGPTNANYIADMVDVEIKKILKG